jgi:hypothetical protein
VLVFGCCAVCACKQATQPPRGVVVIGSSSLGVPHYCLALFVLPCVVPAATFPIQSVVMCMPTLMFRVCCCVLLPAATSPSHLKQKVKAAVPLRTDKPLMGLTSNKNYITSNASTYHNSKQIQLLTRMNTNTHLLTVRNTPCRHTGAKYLAGCSSITCSLKQLWCIC